jgi:hypothetical protein
MRAAGGLGTPKTPSALRSVEKQPTAIVAFAFPDWAAVITASDQLGCGDSEHAGEIAQVG